MKIDQIQVGKKYFVECVSYDLFTRKTGKAVVPLKCLGVNKEENTVLFKFSYTREIQETHIDYVVCEDTRVGFFKKIINPFKRIINWFIYDFSFWPPVFFIGLLILLCYLLNWY